MARGREGACVPRRWSFSRVGDAIVRGLVGLVGAGSMDPGRTRRLGLVGLLRARTSRGPLPDTKSMGGWPDGAMGELEQFDIVVAEDK